MAVMTQAAAIPARIRMVGLRLMTISSSSSSSASGAYRRGFPPFSSAWMALTER